MKKYLFITLTILLTGASSSSVFAQGMIFNHGTWAEIKAMAKAQNKLIFVDFYTVWCAPCKQMTMEVFPQKEAGDFYNKNFIAYKVDAEKGEGPALARAYKVSGYPTLAYINYDGEVIHRLTSSTDVKELIEHGKMALTPRNDYEQLKDKFVKNELSKADLYRYFILVKTKGDAKETNIVFDRYFEVVANVSDETFQLISDNVSSTDSKPFKYLETHVNDFSKLLGKEKVVGFIRNEYVKQFETKVWYKTFPTLAAYQDAKTGLKKEIILTAQEELGFDTDYYLRAEDEENYVVNANKLVEKFDYNDEEKIGHILGGATRLVKKEKNLLIVKSWAERALALNNNFINNASLAMVYKSLKNKPMAVKYIDIAIAQCKQEKNGYEDKAGMLKKEIEEAAY